jgi:hypothetical protein
MLKADPTFPSRRTFVLKMRDDATPIAFRGRLENLVTCKSEDFHSAHELLLLLARDLGVSVAEPPGQP